MLALATAEAALAAAFLLRDRLDPFGAWFAPVAFIVAAVASAVCIVWPSRQALTWSLCGLAAGYLERAFAIPVSSLQGNDQLVVGPRPWLATAVYLFLTTAISMLWIKLLLPTVVTHECARRSRSC
jgi:hypothetical protein